MCEIAAFVAEPVVLCAFGRARNNVCDIYNIKPYLVSLAKALSAAYMPIDAVLMSPEIADVIHSQSNKLGAFSHGFTYSGHPVACVVALEAVKIYQYGCVAFFFGYIQLLLPIELRFLCWGLRERNIVEQVQKVSPTFQNGIKAFFNSPIIGEIRGAGLIIGTEFIANKSATDFPPPEWGGGTIFGQECQKHGMLVHVAGDSIMMCPPFIIHPKSRRDRPVDKNLWRDIESY